MTRSHRAPSCAKTLAGGFFAFLVFTAIGFAEKVHIPGNQIEFTDIGTQLETDLKVSGLGNADVTIQITALGVADTTVVNPAGNPAPGQQIGVVSSGTETIPSDQIKNGTVELVLVTEEPEIDFDLPNPQWTGILDDVTFDEVTVTVIQNGKVVFQKTYTL
jgi:hypothetical protein